MKWLKNLFNKKESNNGIDKPRWITKDNFKIKKCSDDTGYEKYYVLCNVYEEKVWREPYGAKFGFDSLKEAKKLIKVDIKWWQDLYIKETTRKCEIIDFDL